MPGYCLAHFGYALIPSGVKLAAKCLRCAYTHRCGALAISMSALRTPCADSDAYLEKMSASSRSYSVTLIHG